MKIEQKNINILLITEAFPYLQMEQFLETEIKYYKHFNNINYTIMPIKGGKEKRDLDSFIYLDNYLIENLNKSLFYNISNFLKSFLNKHFYKELIIHKIYNLKKLKSFIFAMIKYINYYDILDIYFQKKNNLENTIVYTYWNNEMTYALQSLKNKYNYKLVSRVHGFDLYEERHPLSYMPLKKQFTEDIDKIFTITESANEYLHKKYYFNFDQIELSRLGVEDNNIRTLSNENNILHIVSCSSLTHVKRVDKIIDALSIIANEQTHITFIWTHIGDGNFFKNLLLKSNEKLSKLRNVIFVFKGHLDNKKVYQFYKDNKIDLFLNTSTSEGVPVSIMEAMSCHIPIVAPNVGGISDMVQNGINGFLLSSKCEINEIVDALNKINFYKNIIIRNNSYKLFKEKYHALNNYKLFLEKLINLSNTKEEK
jgi:glycosyltransferase involved in cell wall biosynthesis